MKVKELIEKLQKCNPEAEVIGYNYSAETDFFVTTIEQIDCATEDDLHYCVSYSVVEDECIGEPIVYLTD